MSAFLGERVYNKQRHLETKAIRVTNPEEEWVVAPEAHEAILPQELFEQVKQAVRAMEWWGWLPSILGWATKW